MTTFIYQHGNYELVHNFHHLFQAFSFLTSKLYNFSGMKSHSLQEKKKKVQNLRPNWYFYIKAESLEQEPMNHENMKVKMLLNDEEIIKV